MIINFDPKKHKGYHLYEIQTYEENGLMVTTLVATDTPFEEAVKSPWYYMVDE